MEPRRPKRRVISPMFERLSEGFSGLFRKLSGKANISEGNVREALEDVRTSLLEADVHQDVVNTFCEEVLADSLGREVTKSLQPGQEMIGIVYNRLIELLGGTPKGFDEATGLPQKPSDR